MIVTVRQPAIDVQGPVISVWRGGMDQTVKWVITIKGHVY
jgi:hypothetical protein